MVERPGPPVSSAHGSSPETADLLNGHPSIYQADALRELPINDKPNEIHFARLSDVLQDRRAITRA